MYYTKLVNGKLTVTSQRPPYYIVRFDSQGGSLIRDQIVLPGGYPTQPVTPTKAGCTFEGWYCKGVKWNFTNNTVSEDIKLVANWE